MDTNVFTIDFETVAPENYFDVELATDIIWSFLRLCHHSENIID